MSIKNSKMTPVMKNQLQKQQLHKRRLYKSLPHKSKGFTLLEALLGFFILSIGMLGIASLQAVSLKAGKSSVYGAVAMMKVDELFESMRAHPSATALAAYAALGASAGTNNSCTGVTDCTVLQLVQDDIFWWKQNLTAGLPATADTSTSVVVIPAVAPSRLATVTVTVSWKERSKDASGSVTKSYTSTSNICNAIPC
jgi:type IV pilus assembly protein PilV